MQEIHQEKYEPINPQLFISMLLIMEKNAHRLVLNKQHILNPNLMGQLEKLLIAKNSVLMNYENYNGLLDDVKRVKRNDSILLQNYENIANPDERQQFIFGLLSLSSEQRTAFLKKQHEQNKHSLPHILLSLSSSRKGRKDVFSTFDSYESLVTEVKRMAVELPQSLPEALREIFTDQVIDFEFLYDPVITPQGKTYNKDVIEAHVQKSKNDPYNRQALTITELLPNKLVNKLIQYYAQPNVDFTQIPDLLKCPIKNEVFKDPVVADDGETYERSALIEYLSKNDDKTPTQKVQRTNIINDEISRDKYKNRLVKELIKYLKLQIKVNAAPAPKAQIEEISVVNNSQRLGDPIPSAAQNPKVSAPTVASPEEIEKQGYKDSLMAYIANRNNDKRGDYFHRFGRCFQFSKTQKTDAAENLIKLIDGKITKDKFLANKTNLKALKQGRLKDSAKDALEYASQTYHFKIK